MFGSVGLAVGRVRIGLLWTDFCRIKLLLLEQNNKNMSTQLANKLGLVIEIRMHRCASDIAPLIASASLPYVSRPVEYHGKLLLDGGCSDRVPLKAFQAMGFTRNVVVLTHPENHRVKDRDTALVRLFYRKYPAFCSTFENSPRVYEETQAYLQDQLSAGTVFVIRPKSPIPLGRLSHDPEAIKRAYNMGCLDALDAAEKLQKWIIENGLH